MDKHVVTNADFRKFVDATGYITMAESAIDPADYPAAAPEMLVLVPASVVLARRPARSWAIFIIGGITYRVRIGDIYVVQEAA